MPEVFANLLGESVYVSQYSTPTIGFVVHIGGVPTNPDNDEVLVSMETVAEEPQAFFTDIPAENPAPGTFEITLTSGHTSTPGLSKMTWDYAVGGVAQQYVSLVEVGEASALYDSLSDPMKGLVEAVWHRFADLFDSPFGGPHLQVYYQTRFGRARIARLLGNALGRLNTFAQPQTTYTQDNFPLDSWGPLLEHLTYIETVKHLIRSYTEQPVAQGVTVARLDRRDYMQRWQDILRMEQEDSKTALEHFKIKHMGLGRPHVMVSGGVYGTYGPTRFAGSAAARPRYHYRFH